jgi:hypothetical protein
MELLERSATMTGHEESAWERTRIRVPRENGTFLIHPEPAVVVRQVDQFRGRPELPGSTDCEILDCPLPDFRVAARAEVITAASEWTSRLAGRDIAAVVDAPLIVTGHQPELFHPGVLAKNFATSRLASRSGGVGLNLIVDNDLMASTRIRIPVGDRERPSFSTIEFDTSRAPIPWEEAHVTDMRLLATFAERIAAAMRPWGINPLVTDCWPAVVQKAREQSDSGRKASLAECLTAGRASLERELGPGNLELPISRLCETNAFRSFAAHILLRARQFCEIYNQVLGEYRRVNRIRSSSHPVPELVLQNGWCETPFWIWEADNPRRGRLFVRQDGETLELATSPDSSSIVYSLNLRPNSSSTAAAAALQQLSEAGLRLRTRALTTTLFTRLCLCDLFVHGIGGAKYDAMTDRIASRFFGVRLPDYLTLSATAWLPIGEPHPATMSDVSRLRQMLRELQQNPQRHLGSDLPDDARQLVTEKNNLIAQQNASESSDSSGQTPLRGHERYRRFPEINRQLAQRTLSQRKLILEELAQIEQSLAANKVLTSREFSFCLYPAEAIRKMIGGLDVRLAR